MPLDHVPQEQFILNSVVRLVADLAEKGRLRVPYNSAVGSGVDEVVRHNLRQMSQERLGFRRWEELLDAAVERSEGQLRRGLSENQLSFDLSPYLGHARDSLETASRELFVLNKKLIESKTRKRIAEKSTATTHDARHTFDVSELGLLGSVEGLLATPTKDVKALNIERVRETYPTQGEWFPFEVSVGDLLFVIDDDGVIFVSTENFPSEMLERAKLILHQVAGALYS
jgi:hypothetical protein